MKRVNFGKQFSILGLVLIQLTFQVSAEKKQHYTHEWAINVDGGEGAARRLAKDYGFDFVRKIIEDYYLVRHNDVAKRSAFPSKFYHRRLAQDPRVHWIAQQVAKRRVKRSISLIQMEFNDPRWHKQWYLNRGDGLDMNVEKAWAMGVTGRGVAVTILDDGIERDHPDLVRNYDPKASFDVNSSDDDPSPRYDFTNENRHGTRCAGEVAAQANNSECGVGIAYDAKIGGVRMLDGDVTDSVEATSLGLNPQHIQIYSASWGPDDDGKTVDGPATLTRKAFHDGISRGRGGLGSIFVWASGNGGREFDSCNCDGYTNSIHTLSISSVTEKGKIPWYSEACSSTLATTYSSGSTGEKQIVTTDIRQSCTESHTGTSASAPLAAGLCALALQANPMLTWRDLQHIVVMTAKPDYLDDPKWTTNGVGRKVSHSFGYGLMDAAAMVQFARNWTTVPPQHICERRSSDQNKLVPMNGKISVLLNTNGCDGTNNHVRYLEHVQARITLKASKRGEIQIFLISPSKTRSTLLAKRPKDTSKEGFNNWAFMSTHYWGEFSQGNWVLEIENGAGSSKVHVQLMDWVLVLYGTDRNPQQPLTTTTATSSTSSTSTARTFFRRKKENDSDRSPNPSTTARTPYRSQDHPSFRQEHFYPNRFPSKPKLTDYLTTVDHSTYNRRKNKDRTHGKKHNKHLRPLHGGMFYNHPPKHLGHEHYRDGHMCMFETMAKHNNVSSRHYFPMYKKDLRAGKDTSHDRFCNTSHHAMLSELKEWTLVIMGTKNHPQAQNITPPANPLQPFTCNGINEHGVCIECKSGFFKLKDSCVKNCPDQYFGIMQLVRLRSAGNGTTRPQKFQRHGICNKCHEACKTCRGPQVDDCFLCNDGYEKRDGLCKKELLLNFLEPDMLGFFIWVIVLCIAAIILFGVIFGLLQARDRHMLCWKGKQHGDDMNCRYNGLTLTREEIENDLENFDIIRNRNFRHASLPETNNPVVRVHVNNFEEDPRLVTYTHTQLDKTASKDTTDSSSKENDVYTNGNRSLLRKYLEYTERQLPKENHYHANGVGPPMHPGLGQGIGQGQGHPSATVSHPSRHSGDKIVGRKHTDSYVSYDINSSLTKTLGQDIRWQVNPAKGQGHLIYPGSRHSASSRH